MDFESPALVCPFLFSCERFFPRFTLRLARKVVTFVRAEVTDELLVHETLAEDAGSDV